MRSVVLPPGLFTGIGSLPLTDVDAAIECVADLSPQIPFWPQLPQRAPEEQMLEQILFPFRDLLEVRDDTLGFTLPRHHRALLAERLTEADAALDDHTAAGFFAFERALRNGRFPAARAFKGQLAGPITMGSYLFLEDQPVLTDPLLFPALCDYLTRLGWWQIQRLQGWGVPVLLFLDEPALPLVESLATQQQIPIRAGLHDLVAALTAQGAMVGIHCCASSVSSSTLAEAAPAIISLDMITAAPRIDGPDFSTYLARGGYMAWGIIPTNVDLAQMDPASLFAHWLLAASQLEDVAVAARQTIVTATCGFGLLDPATATHSLILARQVAELVWSVATGSESVA